VFAFLTDIQNYPLWMAGLVEVKATNGTEVGSVIKFRLRRIRPEIEMEAVVTKNDGRAEFWRGGHSRTDKL